MPLARRLLIDGAVFCFLALVQWRLASWAMQVPGWRDRRTLIYRLGVLSCVLIAAGMILPFQRASLYIPVSLVELFQGGVMLWAFATLGFLVLAFFWRQVPPVQFERRAFLGKVATASFALPVVVEGYGMFVQRDQFQVREVNLPVANLPRDLHGLRLVQITDIHLSEFLAEREFARAIDMANEQKANIALVTGDLITRYRDPLDACLRQLSRLKSDAGIVGCLGNHEVYASAEEYVTREGAKYGMEFLRMQSRPMRFGNATLNIAGVDYQQIKKPYLVGAEKLVRQEPNLVNLLLSHNPDVFPVAVRQGYEAIVAGHTHGGQITFELLDQYVNAARMYTPYVKGLYEIGRSSLYVSSGIGTIGLPVRLGTPPEITVLRLCAS